MTMLACLEIKKSKDKDGKEITPSTEMTTGATRYVEYCKDGRS